MKIVFICSCLEKGFDGVGDYTRRLALALIQNNNAAALIALNDKFVDDDFAGTQPDGGINLPILRLTAKAPVKARIVKARHYIDEFDPDWLSLQFVIFGYHSKGLPFGLASNLAALGGGRRWHIMFHELWVGMATESPVKQKYWGKVQKNIIKNLIHRVKPAVIHTHSTLYQAQLNKLGFSAAHLNLFGNIPVKAGHEKDKDQDEMADKPFTLAVFGTIHPGAPIRQFAKEAAEYAHREKVKFLLKIIGRNGPQGDIWANEWKAAGLQVEVVGEQSPEVISDTLLTASAGISSSAYFMIEKSGTAAAMLEHGLPVICVSGAYTPKELSTLNINLRFVEYKPGNFAACVQKPKAPLEDRLQAAADQFVEDLNEAFVETSHNEFN